MDAILRLVEILNQYLWNSLLLVALVGTGVYFTIRLGFVQVRKLGQGLKFTLGGLTLRGEKADHQGMSSFQALATAVAGQVGTGTIAGAATAIVSGGPGAIFWMWVSAFFGMATNYTEAVLAQKYRTTDENGKLATDAMKNMDAGTVCAISADGPSVPFLRTSSLPMVQAPLPQA